LSTSSVTANLEGETLLPIIPIPGFFFISTSKGSIFMSTDNRVTFERLGDSGQFAQAPFVGPPAHFAIFPPTKTIYAVEWTTGDILKWVVGESTAWEIEIANADLPALLTGT
jgi:hypothetical protein